MIFSIKYALPVTILCIQLVCVTLVDAKTNDELFNSIFYYSKDEMTELEVRMGLIQLNSFSAGLAWEDPRRADALYWLDAAFNQESKCSGKDDELLRNKLHDAVLKAGAKRFRDRVDDEVLNLEGYVKGIRAERLLYCDAAIGRQFNDEIKLWLTDKRKALRDLVKFNGYGQIRTNEIARRIAEMITNNLDHHSCLLLSVKLDHYEIIKRHYEHFSPCGGILRIVDHYRDYYDLLIAPGNYPLLSPVMKVRVDEVSVCLFIQETPQIFLNVADHLLDIFKDKYNMTWPCIDINQSENPEFMGM